MERSIPKFQSSQEITEAFSMYGFLESSNAMWRTTRCYSAAIPNTSIEICVLYYPETECFDVQVSDTKYKKVIDYLQTHRLLTVIRRLDRLYNKFNHSIFNCISINDTDHRTQTVTASSRDLTQDLVRVKSSNIWAYSMNIKDRKSGIGDIVVQFKAPHGGPGDIYIYYDVPVRVYRRWQSAPSKGHYFWQYIRNFYKYSKLTGNKHGVLPNAVN